MTERDVVDIFGLKPSRPGGRTQSNIRPGYRSTRW